VPLLTDQQTFKIYPTVAAAEAAVPEDDEDFKFAVIPDPLGSGKAIIKVYDAGTGDFIANLF
jgi:hypothetical protein